LNVVEQQRVVVVGRVAPHLGHDLLAQPAFGAYGEVIGRGLAERRQANVAGVAARRRLRPQRRRGQCGGQRRGQQQPGRQFVFHARGYHAPDKLLQRKRA
jgi:hypothetical protein